MTRIVCIIFVSLAGLVSGQVVKSAAENYDYCDPKLKLCETAADHVMCRYPFPGLSDKCTPGVFEPLTADEKKRTLYWHNRFRSNVAIKNDKNVNKKLPSSSNMRQLYWDKELQLLAERWAQQCISSTAPRIYDRCRNIKRFQVSQNVGTRLLNTTTRDKQTPQIVVNWFKESKDFLPAYVDDFPSAMEDRITAKQFANMIWANSYAIGCARAIFQENLSSIDKGAKKITTWTVERLICNYGPSESMAGKSLYKRGAPCENCPEGTECSRTFPGLCALQNVDPLEGLPSEKNRESRNETTPLISAVQGTSQSNKSEENTNQDGRVFQLGETESEEEEEGEDHSVRISDLTRFNEILKNPNMPSGGKYLVKDGIYLNGKCHCSNIQRSRGWVTRAQTECLLILLAASRLTAVS